MVELFAGSCRMTHAFRAFAKTNRELSRTCVCGLAIIILNLFNKDPKATGHSLTTSYWLRQMVYVVMTLHR